MQGGPAANLDYFVYALLVTALFALLDMWLRRRAPRGRLPLAAWPGLAFLLVGGWFLVDDAAHEERRRIQGFLEGIAPTYAQELERLGHSQLSLDTPADDPKYVAMLEATRRWKRVNPVVSDIYTFRMIGGRVRLMLSSETDYNRNGLIDGPREQRVPIGTEYPEADPGMLRALDGEFTFSENPVRDGWGAWVSAQVPLRTPDGQLEAAVGVDYPAEEWIEAIALARQRMLWLLAVPSLFLGFGAATAGIRRAEQLARLRIEAQLRESEARLRTAIDSMPFDFWMMDREGRYTLLNAYSRQQWGSRPGQGLDDLAISPSTRAQWEENNSRAFAGEVVRGEITIESGGKWRHFLNVIAPVQIEGKVVGILGLNVDVSDRISAEEARTRSEQRLALHVRQTPLAVIEFDTDFRITAWNPSAEKIFGYTAEEAVGRAGIELLVPPLLRVSIGELWKGLISGTGGARSTSQNVTKDGRTIQCEWYNTTLVGADGRVFGVASHCQDVTERAALQRRVQQTQKIESLGQLAAGVAHEFNNLLTPMLIQLELLREERSADAGLVASLATIERVIHQASQLNQRILAVGRRTAEQREWIPLNPIIDDAFKLMRHTVDRRIDIVLQLEGGLEPVYVERAQISQVVVNLVLNARDALEQRQAESAVPADWRPRIVIRTHSGQSAGRISDASAAPVSVPCQTISVIDNGTGMAPEVRAHIFEPFYTTKPPGRGTGLGLSVVWNSVRAFDGWIEVESQPGAGTSFHVSFPLRNGAAPEPAPAPAVGAGDDKRAPALRILLAEDNALVAETIAKLLKRAGHEVTLTQNGREAWDAFQSFGGRYDLVVTDQNMPEMDGTELIRRLRSTDSKVRVIMVSGHLTKARIQELESLGIDGFLEKPFVPKDLFALLATG